MWQVFVHERHKKKRCPVYKYCANLPPSASAGALALGLSTGGHGDGLFSSRLVQLVRRSADFAGSAVPVVDHLESENGVEDEARDKTVEDELVVDFLEGREDTREGAEEVVEDLEAARLVYAEEKVVRCDLRRKRSADQCHPVARQS